MKRNVILLVIDALNYKKINDKNMPYLTSLMKSSTYTTNMYSQAPYTEAALMSLIGGQNTLTNGAYMKRLSNCYTVLNVYADNDFKVFANCYQPGIFPTGAIKGATDKYYNICFDFNGCWNYRLKYYLDLYKKNMLDDNDYELIIEILDDNLKEWDHFFNSLIYNKKDIEMLYDLIDITEIEENYNILKNEMKLFEKDKKEYLIKLFDNPEESLLFTIKQYDIDKISKNKDFMLKQIEKRKKIFKKILHKNFYYNLKNNRLPWKSIKNHFKKKSYKSIIEIFKSYINCLYDKDLMKRNELIGYGKMKYAPSMLTQLDHFKKWAAINKDPFCAYLHFDDIHYPEFFFSYDSLDEKLLDEQFSNVTNFIDNLPKNYKGNLAYDLSLNYVDNCLKKFISSLENTDLLDNTDIMITADHGNSYGFTPLRESYVNNFYDENYHIPFVWYSKNKSECKIDYLCSSVDIPATMLSINNIKKPSNFAGDSILKRKKDYVYLEYMGAGCPDIKRRNLLIGVKTADYKVIIENSVFNSFDKHNKVYVFDVKNDQFEQTNLAFDKQIDDKIGYELELIKSRFNELKEEWR